MDAATLQSLGQELHRALTDRSPLEPLSDRYPDLGLEDAYRIQEAMLACRIAAGDQVVGKKIGITSQAVMELLNVRQPDFGLLLESMNAPDGSTLPRSRFIAPRAEGEIAFVLDRDLEGPDVTPEGVLEATGSVCACFEIVDSRIRDWRIRIQDTVADNASCGAFVLGPRRARPSAAELIASTMTLEKNGQVVVTGSGAATMGSPLNTIAWLVNALAPLGQQLRRGDIILSGALGSMIPVQAGDRLHVRISGIGDASVNFC